MRIVFDFHGKHPCVGGGGNVYANAITKQPEWPGFQVDLIIQDVEQAHDGKPFWEGDAIHLEGNGETIKEALKLALDVITTVEELSQKQFARRVERTAQCVCGCWIEKRDDGKFPTHHAVLTEGQPLCPEGVKESR